MCMTLMLTAALAGLQPGTCALSCQVQRTLIASESGDTGWALDTYDNAPGGWFRVYRVHDEWRMILEQEPRQCQRG